MLDFSKIGALALRISQVTKEQVINSKDSVEYCDFIDKVFAAKIFKSLMPEYAINDRVFCPYFDSKENKIYFPRKMQDNAQKELAAAYKLYLTHNIAERAISNDEINFEENSVQNVAFICTLELRLFKLLEE